MQTVRVSRIGGPEVLEIVVSHRPVPKPGEVLVEVEAAGINYVDVYQRQGRVEMPKPYTPGLEGVGIVRAITRGTSTLKAGQRVAWINTLGSYAAQIAASRESGDRRSGPFTVDQAMLFQGLTAQYLLAEYRSIKPGDVELVHAAAGGVGQLLVQWLKHLGAVVIGTASSEEKLRTVRSLLNKGARRFLMSNSSSSPQKVLMGKTALVTGASRGIGAAIARRLAADGADVAISYAASADKAAAVVRELEPHGVRATAFKADQADAVQVTKLIKDVAAKFGRLDILVNNAVVFVMGLVGDPSADYAALDRQLATNIGGVVAAVREAAKVIGAGGRIITIGSNGTDGVPFGGSAEYVGSKAALAAFSRGWSRDLGTNGITVNTVQPGPIATEMNPDRGDFAEMLKGMSALRRYGKPEEIAAAVAFLANPSASYVTGSTLTVDGGVSA